MGSWRILVIGVMRQCHDRLVAAGANGSLLIGKLRTLTTDLGKMYHRHTPDSRR
jgi:hypothetical protein